MNEALRDWVTNVHDTFYCIGTAAGPHPYPEMVRDFQSVIGRETREQIWRAKDVCRTRWSRASAVAPTQWESSSVPDRREREALRRRSRGPWPRQTARRSTFRRQARRLARQPHLFAAERRRPDRGSALDQRGLDYPGVGPEHSYLKDPAAPSISPPPTTKRSPRSSSAPSSKASCPHSNPRTRWRASARSHASLSRRGPYRHQSLRQGRQGLQFRCKLSERRDAEGKGSARIAEHHSASNHASPR